MYCITLPQMGIEDLTLPASLPPSLTHLCLRFARRSARSVVHCRFAVARRCAVVCGLRGVRGCIGSVRVLGACDSTETTPHGAAPRARMLRVVQLESQVLRGFEPRLLDSGSRVLTVTPQDRRETRKAWRWVRCCRSIAPGACHQRRPRSGHVATRTDHRSHFGSRYTSGCCSHAGLFCGRGWSDARPANNVVACSLGARQWRPLSRVHQAVGG